MLAAYARHRTSIPRLNMGEFDLIARYFTRPAARAVLGVGDDCALLQPPPGMQLAISSDMLVEGRHFFPDVDPAALGHKALAVNLSDLAACGATPRAFTLALALPHADPAWLAAFSGGLWALAEAHGCDLIGGDTTQGPLNLCITVFGEVPAGQALLRSGARAGDDIYVSGTLGDARMALEARRGKLAVSAGLLAQAQARMDRPTPRVALGQALRGIATAAIDISDGLAGDLGHVLTASGVGAAVDLPAAMTLIAASARQMGGSGTFDTQNPGRNLLEYVFSGGDDYELAFTAPPSVREAVAAAASQSGTAVTRIGRTAAEPGLRLHNADGSLCPQAFASFDHFANP